MKVNGKIISSLQDLSHNFNFFEVWQKLSVFKRDINPSVVSFSEDQQEYYDFLISAENVELSPDTMTLGDMTKVLTESQIEVSKISDFSIADRVRIISLFAIVDKEIPLNQLKELLRPLSDFGDTIRLSNGKSIPLYEGEINCDNLTTKKIIVLASSPNESRIGDVILKPGEATYGVFANDRLIKVCPNEQYNLSYHLKFHLLNNDETKMIVTNLSTGSIIAEYPECTYFGTLRHDNFIIINKGNVDCFNDQHLMNMIRKKIGFIDEPQFFDISSDIITVTLKNGKRIIINY